MDDLISRQAAITALSHMCSEDEKGITVSRANVDSMLKSLLPVQPEQKIYRNMSEEEFEAWLYNHGICHPDIHESIACDIVPSLIDDAINELPPAPPYYVTGFWLIRKWGDDAKCSNCGRTSEGVYDMDNYDGFCRHCGAKMEGLRVIK